MNAARRLAAILAADVVGYSRLMGEDEAGTARAVSERREAARPIIAGLGGRIVKTTGDGLLLEFPSVVAAVECAIAIQKLMAERNAEMPEAKRILYRIGVNLGDVLIEGDDILGDGVNIAARLESICEPGGVLISGSAFDHVRGRIEARFSDVGEKDLKNIARPVRAYSVEAGAPAKPATEAKPSAPKRRSRLALLAAGFVALAVIAAGSWHFLAATRTATLAAGSTSRPAADNVLALGALSVKAWLPAALGFTADPEADFRRADELVSKALALDPNFAGAHMVKANILRVQGHRDEAIAENERAIALDPAMADAVESLGVDYMGLGQFDKSLEYLDKAIRLSPHDPNPGFWYDFKGADYFGLKQYDQAVEWTRRSIAVNSNVNPMAHAALIAAFALTGHDGEAREALQRYLAIPPTALKTIAAWRSYMMAHDASAYPPYLEFSNRLIDELRKAGMPEK